MTEESVARRRRLDRERYLRQREERLARQREYYMEHREELLARKREKALCRPVQTLQSKGRKEINHDWYVRNRETHIAKVMERYYSVKKPREDAEK